MSKYIFGIHDPGGEALMADAPGTVVYTVNVAEDTPVDFSALSERGYRALVRLNHSHHGQGTIPPNAADWPTFAETCALFVAGCRGVRDFTLGNEPNLQVEWGRPEPVLPEQYAVCYNLVHAAVKARKPSAQLAPAAIGPWNLQSGVEWVNYFRRMLDAIPHPRIDFLCLHAYSRGYSPQSVTDNAWMDAPHHNRHNGFRAFKDFLDTVPAGLRDRPVDIKETNGNEPWPDQNTGWVQAAYAEIHRHNTIVGSQKIRSLCLFRWAHFDTRWDFSNRPGVHADFRAAVAQKYAAPDATVSAQPTPMPTPMPTINLPTVSAGPVAAAPVAVTSKRDWDERLTQRGIELTEAMPEAGALYWRIVSGEYWEEKEHTFAETLDEAGDRMPGVAMIWWWADGEESKLTELKPGDRWMVDFPMYASGRSYGLEALGYPSDKVFGMGLGSVEAPNMGIHVSYKFVFQLTRASGVQKPAPPPAVKPQPRPPATVPTLRHPVVDARYRRVSQGWGARPEYYSRYSYNGVPLRGHNGIDYLTPIGTPIRAVDGGRVVEAQFDSGWGNYIKIAHSWGESLYAHLQTFMVVAGAVVAAAQPIALSGNSGNSTGPHLHYGMRITPYERGDGWGGFTDPTPYLAAADGESPVDPAPPANIVATVREAAREFSVDENLLLSLIWKESSYNPNAVNQSSGAKGLGQFMPLTWTEQSAIVGATDIFDARDNARAAAHYLRSLIQTTGSVRSGLWAYVWGPGRVLDLGKPGKPTQPPPEVIEYANTVLHGRDLLDAVMP